MLKTYRARCHCGRVVIEAELAALTVPHGDGLHDRGDAVPAFTPHL
jgi:hypothetical protein